MKHRIIDAEYLSEYVFVNTKGLILRYEFYFIDEYISDNIVELCNWIRANYDVDEYSITLMKLEISRRLFKIENDWHLLHPFQTIKEKHNDNIRTNN